MNNPTWMSDSLTKTSSNFCVRTAKWVPVLFVLTIFLWSYYAYVLEFCFLTVDSTSARIAFLVIHQILFLTMLWSYLQTIYIKTGVVPEKFKLPPMEYELLECAETFRMQRQILENFANDLPVTNRTSHGTVRYCEKCKLVKPDRAHHCSVCRKCILKMDHHCPWINNCVGFTNYKCFVLFLAYSFSYSLFIALSTLPYFLKYWKNGVQGTGKFHVLLLFIVALMFAISLISLFTYHCYLVVTNRTTLESFRAPIFESGSDKHGYDLGYCENLKEVFGDDPEMWLIPVNTSRGDGVVFPMHGKNQKRNSYDSMGNGKVWVLESNLSENEAQTEWLLCDVSLFFSSCKNVKCCSKTCFICINTLVVSNQTCLMSKISKFFFSYF